MAYLLIFFLPAQRMHIEESSLRGCAPGCCYVKGIFQEAGRWS